MTHWSYDHDRQSGTLMIEGDMTIGHIRELKGRLVEAFDAADAVTVDVSAATSVDVAGVQLLCACHRFSSGRGKTMCLQIGGNERIERFLASIGLSRDSVCGQVHDDCCLWAE